MLFKELAHQIILQNKDPIKLSFGTKSPKIDELKN